MINKLLLVLSLLFSFSFVHADEQVTKDDMVKFVKEAVAYAKANGKEAALKEFSNLKGKFVRGELYLYAYDFDGKNLAHGNKPALVGQNLSGMKDPNGVMVIQELIKQAKNGSGWVKFMWAHPDKKENWLKIGYAEKVDDNWWVGSGIYKNDKNAKEFDTFEKWANK